MDKILAGKPVSSAILQSIISQTVRMTIKPVLAIVTFSNDPSSEYYFSNIVKTASKVGIQAYLSVMSPQVSEQELIMHISELNNDTRIDGILLQKPLPLHLNDILVSNQISIYKDVDGINSANLGKLFTGEDGFIPCTAEAVMELIKYYDIETDGKHVVILGRSNVISKPLAALLLHKGKYGNATVTVCHSHTTDLLSITSNADILISAIGKAHFIVPDFIKPGAICIDVGINMINDPEQGNIYVGDIDFNQCQTKAQAITPVPGGIGSITTSILLRNLLKAAIKRQTQEKSLTDI
jgi:methylenetetrahydrofolate dehydrogenase (NADP+)/methenyltetrahydrofolate cyclohydrolase